MQVPQGTHFSREGAVWHAQPLCPTCMVPPQLFLQWAAEAAQQHATAVFARACCLWQATQLGTMYSAVVLLPLQQVVGQT